MLLGKPEWVKEQRRKPRTKHWPTMDADGPCLVPQSAWVQTSAARFQRSVRLPGILTVGSIFWKQKETKPDPEPGLGIEPP
jgi:hypothetical protein